MKKILTLVAVVALTASSAFAGDISTSRAARLGLAGMQPMSQNQGAEIRGMGFAVVYGSGSAVVNSTTGSANGYAAGSFRSSNSRAGGFNASFAVRNGSYAASGGASAAYAR